MKNNKTNERFNIEVVKGICGDDPDVDMMRTKECANFQINPGTVGFGDDRTIEFFSHTEYTAEYVMEHGNCPCDITSISA